MPAHRYMRADVNVSQVRTEAASTELVAALDKEVARTVQAAGAGAGAGVGAGGGGRGVRGVVLPVGLLANLTAAYIANAKAVVTHWWTLPDILIARLVPLHPSLSLSLFLFLVYVCAVGFTSRARALSLSHSLFTPYQP